MPTLFVRARDSTIAETSTLDAAERAWSEGAAVWIDLESHSELDGVRKRFELHPGLLDDCELCELHPEVERFGDQVCLVCYEVANPESPSALTLQRVQLICGERFLITVHAEPSRVIRTLSESCAAGAPPLTKGVAFLVHAIVDRIVAGYLLASENLQSVLDRAEDESLEPHVDQSLLERVGNLRQPLLELHRVALLQREALIPVVRGEFDPVAGGLGDAFDHVRDHLAQVLGGIEAQRDLAKLIRDNYNARLAERMSVVMKTLTVFASILLPLSLITGFYGMNLVLWPGTGEPTGVRWVLGAMAFVTAALLLYFWRRRWL